MPHVNKIIFRKMRREFARFPNLDVSETVKLGKVGFFDNRRAFFNWKTSLDRLNLFISEEPRDDKFPICDELYTSYGGVETQFRVTEEKFGTADFLFRKKYAVAAQAIGTESKALDIDSLEQQIVKGINNGSLKWNKKWVVVTEVFVASAFSLLVGSSSGGMASVRTNIPITQLGFNIADPNLSLSISGAKQMGKQIIARRNVVPFFRVHRVCGNWKSGKLSLEPYGRN
ncbi:hypothetical protein STSP2_01056 [Anaerohalosphaera lusitana]|uniref:Uncharacterized protein n=1 Tax=Anaerohalosphaera lusitana TaxID=1936003 RepID=A0A1U9NJJ4_9BACT|nr:hypothetical protein [Anaerohalosphaera lusitana]AQT67904.1 hypothetical protein STSP2_01056 [Anaerohalosphaera lusitana]